MPVAERSPAVKLGNVVALLGNFPALSGLSLELPRGEILSVTGPNGAGKSTLLRVIAGLVHMSTGEGMVLGTDISPGRASPRQLRSLRSRVGYLGHSTGLFGDLDARENVELVSKASGAGSGGVEAALSAVGLSEREIRVRAGSMSAGQRKRTAIASLLARRTLLWLLDEPHAGLDPGARDFLDAAISGAATSGVTVIIASHDVDRVSTLADQYAEVAGGTIVRSGFLQRPHPVAPAAEGLGAGSVA